MECKPPIKNLFMVMTHDLSFGPFGTLLKKWWMMNIFWTPASGLRSSWVQTFPATPSMFRLWAPQPVEYSKVYENSQKKAGCRLCYRMISDDSQERRADWVWLFVKGTKHLLERSDSNLQSTYLASERYYLHGSSPDDMCFVAFIQYMGRLWHELPREW